MAPTEKKKKRKRKESKTAEEDPKDDTVAVQDGGNEESLVVCSKPEKKKSEKKKKLDKKSKTNNKKTLDGEHAEPNKEETQKVETNKVEDEVGGASEENPRNDEIDDGSKKNQPLTSKDIRKARREERKRLLELVPKTDEHGIAYTKQQIRFMRKRVARGLDPIETEQEKAQRLKQESELRREEEAELAGILYQKDTTKDGRGDTKEDNDVGGDAKDEDGDDDYDDHSNNDEKDMPTSETRQGPPKKKKRRTKPVPTDYTCQACQNKHTPAHWIYDCPAKVTMRGTNQISAKQKGLHDPDARKVFVSGLPFDATKANVTKLFSPCGKLQFCKLLTFADSGRCKGQAILSFTSLEGAQKALEQNGSVIENNADETEHISGNNNDKKKDKTDKKARRKLKLSVTKLLNRSQTKQRKKPPPATPVSGNQ